MGKIKATLEKPGDQYCLFDTPYFIYVGKSKQWLILYGKVLTYL